MTEENRELYRPAADGGFLLDQELTQLQNQILADRADFEARIAELDRKSEAAQARLQASLLAEAAGEALKEAGVDRGLKEGAVALFLELHELTLAPDGREVRDATGTPLRQLVEDWTAEGSEGARYLSGYRQRKAATIGFFAQRLRDLARDPLQ